MRRIILLIYFFFVVFCSHAQLNVDSARKKLTYAKEDTSKARLLIRAYGYYTERKKDSALYYAQEALQLSMKLNYQWGIGSAYGSLCYVYTDFGNYEKALEYGLKSVCSIWKK